MRVLQKVKSKLKQNNGETLSEALIAMLVSVLGMVLLASAITTATNLVITSKKKMQSYWSAERTMILNSDGKELTESYSPNIGTIQIMNEMGTKVIPLTDKSDPSIMVKYVTSRFGSKDRIIIFNKYAPDADPTPEVLETEGDGHE